jgi:hypothetical protein
MSAGCSSRCGSRKLANVLVAMSLLGMVWSPRLHGATPVEEKVAQCWASYQSWLEECAQDLADAVKVCIIPCAAAKRCPWFAPLCAACKVGGLLAYEGCRTAAEVWLAGCLKKATGA